MDLGCAPRPPKPIRGTKGVAERTFQEVPLEIRVWSTMSRPDECHSSKKQNEARDDSMTHVDDDLSGNLAAGLFSWKRWLVTFQLGLMTTLVVVSVAPGSLCGAAPVSVYSMELPAGSFRWGLSAFAKM